MGDAKFAEHFYPDQLWKLNPRPSDLGCDALPTELHLFTPSFADRLSLGYDQFAPLSKILQQSLVIPLAT